MIKEMIKEVLEGIFKLWKCFGEDKTKDGEETGEY